MRATILLVLVLALSAWPAPAQDGFKVIVHPSNTTAAIPRDQLARYFLKKTTSWPDRRPVVPYDQGEAAAARRAFSRQVLGKDLAEVTAYWQQLIFSGRGVPPIVKLSDAQVLAAVREHPGAIGYVAEGAATNGVKVVQVVD